MVVCKNGETRKSVEHYYNGNSVQLLDSNDPTIGISNANVQLENGKIICSMTRDNSNPDAKYFDVNAKNPFVIAAYGRLNGESRQTPLLLLLFVE